MVYVIWDNTGTATVTDSRGDSFTSVSAPVVWDGSFKAQVFYATNIVGGTDTVTATFQNSVRIFGNIYVHEYSGISTTSPVDVTASASGSGTTLNSGSATTTSANDLIFGAGVSDNQVTLGGLGLYVPRPGQRQHHRRQDGSNDWFVFRDGYPQRSELGHANGRFPSGALRLTGSRRFGDLNRLQAALNGAALRTTGKLYRAVRHDGAMRERIFTDVHDRFFSKLSDAELDIVESEIKAGRSLV